MLGYKKKNLHGEFLCWISIGGFVLILVLVALWWRSPYCPPPSNVWAAHGHQYSNPNKDGTDIFALIFSGGKKNAKERNKEAGEESNYSLPEELCFEVKFGDLAIAFFTYCLVIVGWFTMRSADENTRLAERAYLVGGPYFGIPKKSTFKDDLSKWAKGDRARKSMFHGPWCMVVTNFGRTAAYSTKIEWGICQFREFPLDMKIVDLLDSQEPARIAWREKWMLGTDFTENIFGETNRAYYLRFTEIDDRDKFEGWVHFGRVSYRDVFGAPHWTTFAYYMMDEYSSAIGRHISEEHD